VLVQLSGLCSQNRQYSLFLRDRYFQSTAALSREFLKLSWKKFIPEKKMRSDQVATKLHFFLSDLIQLSAEKNIFRLPIHPMGLLEKQATTLLPLSIKKQFIKTFVPDGLPPCTKVQKVIDALKGECDESLLEVDTKSNIKLELEPVTSTQRGRMQQGDELDVG